MTKVLCLMALQGAVGAFDTIYYHEWRAKLPARGASARAELELHAARDFVYALLFTSLPHLAWRGLWGFALIAALVAEIFLTFWDFMVEDVGRKPLGGLYRGERNTHAVMGIVYGAIVAFLVPILKEWIRLPTELAAAPAGPPVWLRYVVVTMGIGVLLSGFRDLCAALGVPHSNWPWRQEGP